MSEDEEELVQRLGILARSLKGNIRLLWFRRNEIGSCTVNFR